MSLAKKTVQGTMWAYASFSGGKVLIFISTIILARLLSPDDFGLMGFALLVIYYLDLRALQMGAALIYKKDEPDKAANTAFIISLLSGLALFLIANLLSPLVASFFQEARVELILRALSLTFIFSSFGYVHEALLEKELDFKKKFIPDLVQGIVKGAISMVLALLGYGAWSLVWGQVVGALAWTLTLWIVLPWRPSFTFYKSVARELLGYGLQLMAADFLCLIHTEADYLIVGKLLGGTALGFYMLAVRAPDFLIINFCAVITRVLFPAYSKLQDDLPALRRGFLTSLKYISLVTIPVGVGLFFVAPDLVLIFYTDKWANSIPVLQALALNAALMSLDWTAGDIYKARGRPDILTKLNVVENVFIIAALWFGAGYGIVGVAMARLLTTALITVIRLFIAHKLLDVGFWTIMREFRFALTGSLAMLMGLYLLRYFSPPLPGLVTLALSILTGACFYLLALWLIHRETILGAGQVVLEAVDRA